MVLDNYGRGMRMDHKRRGAPRTEPPAAEKQAPPAAPPAAAPPAAPALAAAPAPAAPRADPADDDKPIPDDLSEISDDPDDILNREDVSSLRTVYEGRLDV